MSVNNQVKDQQKAALLACIAALLREKAFILVGIDGGGGSGKTTLAQELSRAFHPSSIVHMDDLYLPSHQRQNGNLAHLPVGSHYDLARVKRDIILPLRRRDQASYQRYDWGSDQLEDSFIVPAKGLVLIEGCYSTCQDVRDLLDVCVFVTCPRHLRLARGLARDGDDALAFWQMWMQGEDAYFAKENPQECADFVIEGYKAAGSF